jgi:hypothetical protein
LISCLTGSVTVPKTTAGERQQKRKYKVILFIIVLDILFQIIYLIRKKSAKSYGGKEERCGWFARYYC